MLPCHHVTLVASIAVVSTPVAKVHAQFLRIQSVSIELHQSGVITWRQFCQSCGVIKNWISWHTVLFNGNGDFYTYDLYPHLNRSVCPLMGSPTWWRFSFCSSGSSLVFWWRDASLVQEFQMWGRRCKQWDSHWFQGHKMRFGGI